MDQSAAAMTMRDLRIFPDRERLSREVAEVFVGACRERASATGRFSVALAGGSTPRLLYELLATELRNEVPWVHVHFFWSDERYVPLDHPDSNYFMVRETLFDRVEVPVENIHAAPTDLDDPHEAALRYERAVRDHFGSGVPRLDWVLLGLGEDGHIASLFPGSLALEEKKRWIIAVGNSPKPPPVRLTMTLPLINQAAQVHLLVSGEAKAQALGCALGGPADANRFPAQGIRPTQGTLTWWLDDEVARHVRDSTLKRDPM